MGVPWCRTGAFGLHPGCCSPAFRPKERAKLAPGCTQCASAGLGYVGQDLSANGTCPLPPSLVSAALDALIRLRREVRHEAN
jgi:hypothetical protein